VQLAHAVIKKEAALQKRMSEEAGAALLERYCEKGMCVSVSERERRRTQTNMHAYIHAHMHTRSHTHIHIHTSGGGAACR
jgi:tartrate dehydratase alpha subunit/fumarate hydratase class I-like protein